MVRSSGKSPKSLRGVTQLFILPVILALLLLYIYTNNDDNYYNNNTQRYSNKAFLQRLSSADNPVPDTQTPISESNLLDARPASSRSPFHIVYNKKKAYEDSVNLGKLPSRRSLGFFHTEEDLHREEMDQLSKLFDDNGNSIGNGGDPLPKCQLLIAAMYERSPRWDNREILKVSEENRRESILVTERLRIYNYCFLKHDLDVLEVFDTKYFRSNGFDAWDFQCRMFPFLNRGFDKEHKVMVPRIVPVSESAREFVGGETAESKLLKYPKEDLLVQARTGDPNLAYNLNFMKFWLKSSKGRGIVTTAEFKDLGLVGNLLRVLQKLKNDLPVELVVTKRDGISGEEFEKALRELGESTNQKLFLVDLSEIIDQNFSLDQIKYYRNKWFAAIFNTFEEEILMDMDVVPFQPMEKFFDEEGYKRTGIHMYRDRMITTPKSKFRQELQTEGSSSLEERVLIGTQMFDESLNGEPRVVKSLSGAAEGSIGETEKETKPYSGFFAYIPFHRVDSGLIPIHKTEKLPGLLMGCFLHMIPRYTSISHGDKEFFWLGQLFAGDEYSIDKIPAGIVGTINETDSVVTVDGEGPGYTICGIQLAHCNEENKLLWCNSGMRVCKFDDAHEVDFKRHREYFEKKWGDPNKLEGHYFSPVRINGMIVPKLGNWKSELECASHSACASYLKSNEKEAGKFIRFNADDASFYDNISLIWNGLLLDILM